ncbi:hypothetical protein JB92DRAFT_122119 [Gautieria morchelliformis]|nr:hypothetical protein JB92DRAFT_122119 [Gautieria morchelliformis]
MSQARKAAASERARQADRRLVLCTCPSCEESPEQHAPPGRMITLRKRRTHEAQAARTRAANFSPASVKGKRRNQSPGGASTINQQIHTGSSRQPSNRGEPTFWPQNAMAGPSQLDHDGDVMMQVDDDHGDNVHVSAMLLSMYVSLSQPVDNICASCCPSAPVTTCLPHTIDATNCSCASIFFTHRPVLRSHMRTVWSSAAERRYFPHGWKDRARTQLSWPTC